MSSDQVVAIRNLEVEFATSAGSATALESISLSVGVGEVVGILGESGCGKSVLAQAILGLIRAPGSIRRGEILFEGNDLASLSDERIWRRLRGESLGYIVSNARAHLDPLNSVGKQIANVIRATDSRLKKKGLLSEAIQALKRVGIPDSDRRVGALPHEFSGGMCQRVVITMALANSPRLLVADEPTSGLDVTVQRQVLDLMRTLVSDHHAGVLMMTRDPGVIAHYCDRVIVIRSGRIVEAGPVRDFFRQPKSEYSRGLLVKAVAAQAGTARGVVEGEYQ